MSRPVPYRFWSSLVTFPIHMFVSPSPILTPSSVSLLYLCPAGVAGTTHYHVMVERSRKIHPSFLPDPLLVLRNSNPQLESFSSFVTIYPIFIVALYLSTTIHAVANINAAVRGSQDERETWTVRL